MYDVVITSAVHLYIQYSTVSMQPAGAAQHACVQSLYYTVRLHVIFNYLN